MSDDEIRRRGAPPIPGPTGARLMAGRDRALAEYEAWQDVVKELRAAGAGELEAGQRHERLHDAITLWGELLVQLRMHDENPRRATSSLVTRRAAYAKWRLAGGDGDDDAA